MNREGILSSLSLFREIHWGSQPVVGGTRGISRSPALGGDQPKVGSGLPKAFLNAEKTRFKSCKMNLSIESPELLAALDRELQLKKIENASEEEWLVLREEITKVEFPADDDVDAWQDFRFRSNVRFAVFRRWFCEDHDAAIAWFLYKSPGWEEESRLLSLFESDLLKIETGNEASELAASLDPRMVEFLEQELQELEVNSLRNTSGRELKQVVENSVLKRDVTAERMVLRKWSKEDLSMAIEWFLESDAGVNEQAQKIAQVVGDWSNLHHLEEPVS